MVDRGQHNNLLIPDFRRVKVVIVGDFCVGKTSIAMRFTRDEFKEKYRSTIAASFFARTLQLNGKKTILQIWDTAGQERYRSLIPMYLRGAEVAILVYDVTSQESFENASFWHNYLKENTPTKLQFALVGNKTDLEDQRAVDKKDAENFAEENHMYFNEVSAKTGDNVEAIFLDIAKKLSTDQKKTSLNRGSSIRLDSKRKNGHHHRCCNK